MAGNEPTPRTVMATETATSILKSLQTLDGAGVTELADHLGLSKSTVHAHLITLEQNELVTKSDDMYRLGLRFLDFGEYVKHSIELYDVAKEEVRKLAQETGELSHLMVEEHGRGVFVIRERGSEAVPVAMSRIGRREYLHCVAVGKAILAYLPREVVAEVVKRHGLPPVTDRTITDVDVLYDELKAIRDRGYAIDDQERLSGFRGVAVPVLNHREEVLGGISVSGPVSRMGDDRIETELPDAVGRAVNIVEINVSYA